MVAERDGPTAEGDEEVQEHRTRMWVRMKRQWQPLPVAPRLSLRRCRWERHECVDAAIAGVGGG